jgi:Xaa-Pro aminopeptidase
MRRLAIAAILLVVTSASARQNNSDYKARRDKLAAKLDTGVLVLFANTEEEGQNALGGFRQNDEFYYLTGLSEPGAGLVIAKGTEVLFLPARNVTQERWTGPKLTAGTPDAKNITGFDRVEALDRMRDELVKILPSPSAVVFTDLSTRGSTPSTVPLQWLRRANAFPNYVSFKDAKDVIGELRLTKDAGEIDLIRRATDATVRAHAAALKAMRPGATENDLAGLIEYEFRKGGAEGPAFSTIVGSGLNSTVLHYRAGDARIADGDVVVIDIGASYGNYASDVTRTLPANGRFTPRQREIYDVVLGAQRAAVNAFVAGKSTIARTAPNSLHKVAMDYIEEHGKLGKYFIHGLSHYVGLAVHDAGDGTKPLGPGAVFTIEPGVYIPEEKIGVRIEDTYLVKADGTLDCLSCGALKDPDAIEKAMKR